MSPALDVVVGLGANLGDRLASLRSAVAAIARRASLRGLSPVYATAPIGPPQPDYLNAAVRLAWEGTPRELLELLLETERALGRVRAEKWGPRVIDLDVLWIDGCLVDEPDLEVPHPRLHERAFALLPLLDVAPDARDPRTGQTFVRLPANDVRETALTLDAPLG